MKIRVEADKSDPYILDVWADSDKQFSEVEGVSDYILMRKNQYFVWIDHRYNPEEVRKAIEELNQE